jgi:FKBP12-rapamycin complex-associated protein
MEGHFKELCDTFLRYRDSKEKVIRKTVVTLLPRIAAISPDAFAKEYLNTCVSYLMTVMKKDVERQRAFISLGEIAVVTMATR